MGWNSNRQSFLQKIMQQSENTNNTCGKQLRADFQFIQQED